MLLQNAPTDNITGRKDGNFMYMTMFHSICWGRSIVHLTILGLVLLLIGSGCASTPTERAETPVSAEKKSSDSIIINAAAAEYGEAAAAELAQTMPPRPRPPIVDQGAAQLIEILSQRSAINDARQDKSEITIAIGKLRNHSRCRHEEFTTLLERLAEQLSIAGRDAGMLFIAEAEAEADFHLNGTAYLITADGFDLWELFFTLHPADASWTIWSAPGPVHMLRQPRPRQQQMFLTQNW